MTVIAWDGKMLAADKQATSSGLRVTCTKIRRAADGSLLAWTGDGAAGMLMANWYDAGQKADEYPKPQADKDEWARLVVIRGGKIHTYDRWPVLLTYEDKFMAFGSGRDFALGAMSMGATAKEAVEIACRFENGCGMGVDYMALE